MMTLLHMNRPPLIRLNMGPINPTVIEQLSIKIKFDFFRHTDVQKISRGKNLEEKSYSQG